jgi:hypothetical protein
MLAVAKGFCRKHHELTNQSDRYSEDTAPTQIAEPWCDTAGIRRIDDERG